MHLSGMSSKKTPVDTRLSKFVYRRHSYGILIFKQTLYVLTFNRLWCQVFIPL